MSKRIYNILRSRKAVITSAFFVLASFGVSAYINENGEEIPDEEVTGGDIFDIGENFNPSSPADPQGVPSHIVTLRSNPDNKANLYNARKYKEGESFTLQANPYYGWKISSWTVDGVNLEEKSEYLKLTMGTAPMDVVVNLEFDPSSPQDPDGIPSHSVIIKTNPENKGSVYPSSSRKYKEGDEVWLEAYPQTGWRITSWVINGERIDNTDSVLKMNMGTEPMNVTVNLAFDPSSPSNPSKNYYNPQTGEMIVDDYKIGNIGSEVNNLRGWSSNNDINNLIVKGVLDQYDYSSLGNLNNVATIDLSRTGGVTQMPDYAFSSSDISTLILPMDVDKIGYLSLAYCQNLTSLVIYSMEPPICNASAFYNTPKENITIYVPASSIGLYAEAETWKDFTLLPIADNAHELQVTLPEDAKDGRYKNYAIELVNLKSNLKQKYVVSDRLTYTFHGLQEDEKYVVYLLSQAGIEIGRIANVVIPNKDSEVKFDNLSPLNSVTAKVTDPEGRDLTAEVAIEWLKPNPDGSTTYLKKAKSISEMPTGQELLCRVTLNEILGSSYKNPEDVSYLVKNDDNICTFVLEPFSKIKISGIVKNNSGKAISSASVSANQKLNGRIIKTFTTKTDKKGEWQLDIYNVPATQLTYSANDYVDYNSELPEIDSNSTSFDCGQTVLKDITGGRIDYYFTYQEAGSTETDNHYNDYQNVLISAYNSTSGKDITEISQQYPVLVLLDENLKPGDKIKLTASSKNGSFNNVESIVELNESLSGKASFNIIGKGGIVATVSSTENPAVVAILYNSTGHFLKKKDYSSSSVTFSNLDDGDYIIITMGKSDLINSFNKLSLFDEMGLVEGKDYVSHFVGVKSGKIENISIDQVPLFDDSQLYYTSSLAGFTPNKNSVTNGNYITLRAQIDFKEAYKSNISNVSLVVDLPEDSELIEQSVIQGTNLLPYIIDNNRLTIQLGDNYSSQVRFCVMPTAGGTFTSTASIYFDNDGKRISQPLGTSVVDVKELELVIPSLVTSSEYHVFGNAPSKSKIEIYEGSQLVGTSTSNNQGTYSISCNVPGDYNLSEHNVYAVITTSNNQKLKSETKTYKYDVNAVKVTSVVMTEGSNVVTFDFEYPDKENKYYYYTFGKFTFIINFNKPEKVNDVLLYVHTTDGSIKAFPATFDPEKNIWFVTNEFTTNALPLNVSVDFDPVVNNIYDENLFNQAYEKDINELVETANEANAEISDIETTNEKELEQLDANLKILSETAEVLIEDTVSEEEYEKNLEEFLSIANPDFKSSDLDIIEKNVYTEEDIDNLLAYGETLLKNEEYNNESLYKLLSESQSYLDELNEEWDGEETLDIDPNEELSFEFEGENYKAKQLTQQQLLDYDLSIYEIEELTLSDGSLIKVYSIDDEWILSNESSGVVFLISLSNPSPIATYSVRDNTIAFLQNLLDEFNVANQKMIGIISDLTEGFREEIKRLTDFVNDLEGEATILNGKSAAKGQRVAEIERQLKELNAAGKSGFKEFDLKAQKTLLQAERKNLIKQIEQINKDLGPVKNRIGSFKVKLATANAMLSEAMDYWQIVDGFVCIIKYIGCGIADFFRWNSFINTILPCPDDPSTAQAIKNHSEQNRNTALRGYIGAFTIAGLSEGLAIALKVSSKLNAACWALKFLCGAISGALLETAKGIYTEVSTNSHNDINNRIRERNKLKCKKDDPYKYPYYYPDDPKNEEPRPNPNGGKHKSGNTDSKYGIDPSGYVYEAVPENRIEGVQATIYYKETKEDMYGDLYEEEILWDAEEYAQENPLFTDENGMYQWDVPQGLWQVRFEKDGYEPTQSEWLPVPPPQLDVNIPITQKIQPQVSDARAYENGVEIQFNKFMDLTTLNDNNIYVTANGEKLTGEIRFIDSKLADEFAAEDDESALRYASRIRFVPERALSAATGAIILTVSKNVHSYAGLPMEMTFSQELDIEKEIQEIKANDVKVLYGSEKEITVFAVPYDAAIGKTLNIENSSEIIARLITDNLLFDSDGKVVIKVKGELPGSAQLTFSIDDVFVKGTTTIDVVTEIWGPSNPVASRLSGTKVYRGTEITLTTDSENAVIYYTLDGSCPCDEATRILYTAPIVINDDTHILAMAYDPEMEDEVSETVEFNYYLKRSDLSYNLEQGYNWISHNMESPVPTAEILKENSDVKSILSQTSEIIRDPKLGAIGTLRELDSDKAYKVEIEKAGAVVSLTDIARNPSLPIELVTGYNWISYPLDQVMTIDEALSDTDAEYEEMIIGRDGSAIFDGEQWIGSLKTLIPGKGYLYLSKEDKDLIYFSDMVSKANAYYAVKKLNNSSWVADRTKYASVMPVIGDVLREDGSIAEEGEYEVAAFCGTECRGVGVYDNGYIFINVYGKAGDEITFRVLAAGCEDAMELPVVESFSEMPLGSISAPYEFRSGEAGVKFVKTDSNVRILIKDQVLQVIGDDVRSVGLYDLNGNKVLFRDKIGDQYVSIAGFAPGIYIVAVDNKGTWSYHKVMLK